MNEEIIKVLDKFHKDVNKLDRVSSIHRVEKLIQTYETALNKIEEIVEYRKE